MSMKSSDISEHVHKLRDRALQDGGFASMPGTAGRPDATAWAVLALTAAGVPSHIITPARSRLAEDQLSDGRISISAEHPEAFWPTPLAILAWQGSVLHRDASTRAVNFLLATAGNHWARNPAMPHAHDTSIRGWPWVDRNHSWIEPTSLALLALQFAGFASHARVQEGVRMLLDRQLSHGGWNIGSKAVYGQEPHPAPDCTGLALSALAGHASKSEVRHSIAYLEKRITDIRSPLSLGWGIIGLSAWGERPAHADAWLNDSLRLQTAYGPYDTALLSLLIFASLTERGLGDTVATEVQP